ncbi:hypothetical protein ACFL96_18055 [Thermoproteota archaeon]
MSSCVNYAFNQIIGSYKTHGKVNMPRIAKRLGISAAVADDLQIKYRRNTSYFRPDSKLLNSSMGVVAGVVVMKRFYDEAERILGGGADK